MKASSKSERRLHPRIDQTLPIKVIANGYDFSTSTMNVSCVGAYCRINKYVPPFTRVMVKLALPVATEKGNKKYDVECSGVIVRSEDASNKGFNIAIFFNDIKVAAKKRLAQYVSQFIPKNASPAKAPQPRWAA